MELKYLRSLSESKSMVHFACYDSVIKELEGICKKEGVKLTHLLRDMVNKFIAEYRSTNPSKEE